MLIVVWYFKVVVFVLIGSKFLILMIDLVWLIGILIVW